MNKIKQCLLAILFVFVGTISANAYDFEVNGIYFEVISFTDFTCRVCKGPSYSCYAGDITIPNRVTYNGKELSVVAIGESAFFGSNNLVSVTLPEGITEIGQLAFGSCTNLSILNISSTVNKIGGSCFIDCKKLESLTIPAQVSELGVSMFNGMENFKELVMLSSIPPTTNAYTFTNELFMNVTLYVPADALNSYLKADNWKNFWNIKEIGDRPNPPMTDPEVSEIVPIKTFSGGFSDLTVAFVKSGCGFIVLGDNKGDSATAYDEDLNEVVKVGNGLELGEYYDQTTSSMLENVAFTQTLFNDDDLLEYICTEKDEYGNCTGFKIMQQDGSCLATLNNGCDSYTIIKTANKTFLAVDYSCMEGDEWINYTYIYEIKKNVTSGIVELKRTERKVTATPNPVRRGEKISINTGTETLTKVFITSMNGQTIKSTQACGTAQFETSDMVSGIYIYSVVAGNRLKASGKIIVK